MDYVEPPSLGRISAIAPAPSRPTTVFAGGADYPGMASPHATLVRSTQDGAPGSWVEVLRMSSISFVDAIAVHPTNPDIVYASVSGQHRTAPYASWSAIRRTVDGGATWVEVFTGTVEISSLAIDRVDPDIVYAATAAQQLYRSVDGGNIWTVVRPSPAEGGGPSGQQVLADARVGGRVYLAGPEAVLESADGGDTWVQIGGPFMPISGSSPLSLVVADHGVHQTLYRGSEGVWTFTRRAHLDRRLYIPTAIAVSP